MADSITIAVDAMGGDYAPEINVGGALLALEADPSLRLILVGQEPAIRRELEKRKVTSLPAGMEIHHCTEVISMEDSATSGVRRKKDSSIFVGLSLVKEKKADAFISAGHSGAVMAGALLVLGRLGGVERPAILIRLPTADGFVIILDGGANVDCKASHLVDFAELGSLYASVIEKIENPRIAVLSNGSESHKGNELTREADEVLRKRPYLRYIGYVEGYDVFRGTADVIVCDGFVGNVILKLAEGLADATVQWLRKEIRKDWIGMAGAVLLSRVFKRFKAKFDYQPYGAAPLVGIDGMVLISHGSSTEIAIKNGILTARRGVENGFVDRIRQHLVKMEGQSKT